MPILPVTPQPFPEESVFSWAVRLANANLVPSPWHIFKLVGFDQGKMKTPTLDTSKLWSLISDDDEILESFRYAKGSGSSGEYSFRGHPIDVRDLDAMSPKLCPDCVDENGYASAHWDLDLVTCCHIHDRRLIRACPACGERISWFRSDLRTCRCGASFKQAPVQEPSVDEAALNQLIYRVAFRKPRDLGEANPAFAALSTVPLRYLLRFVTSIGTLSTQGRLVPDKKNRIDVTKVIVSAGQVLAGWPESFHAFLSQLTSRPSREKQERFGVLGCINDFSDAILIRNRDRQHGAFCHREVRKFLAQTWDGPLDSQIVCDLIKEGLTPKWIPLRLAARRLKIDVRTLRIIMNRGLIEFKTESTPCTQRTILSSEDLNKLASIMNSGLIKPKAESPSYTKRILLRSEDIKPQWFVQTELLNVRVAAANLGLPVSVLSDLRKTGEYVQTYFGPHAISYALRDVAALKKKIVSGKHYKPIDPDHGVSLGSVMQMKFRNISAKADVIRSIIRGDIRTEDAAPEKLGELALHPDDLEGALRKITLPDSSSITAMQAGKAIHTTKEVTEYLANHGYLNKRKDGLIDTNSIRGFLEKYTSLNSMLEYQKTKIARAEQILAQEGMPLISAPNRYGGASRFMRNADVLLVKKLILKRPTSSSRRTSESTSDVSPRYPVADRLAT